MKGFLTFIREQGVAGLAIGFILGGAVSKTVTSLVEDVINPLLGILLNKVGDLSAASSTIGGSEIKWGNFILALINFVVVALVVYVGIKVVKVKKLDKKEKGA